MSNPSVKAIFVLDGEGNRLCAKYYDRASYPTLKDQTTLEKKIWAKTKNMNARMEAEIILIDNIVSVFRSQNENTIFVIGSAQENELILLHVLDGAFEAVSNMLKGHMDRHSILDNLELVLLTFDEVLDGGVIFETDTQSITNRVLMRGIDNEVPLTELTIGQAFMTVREQWSRSFRSG
ncbi:coatomer subunit zeta-1 [Thraustotheca clavata]|uniref:Coatomer subunit zeta n=1 Tax=Thraustotheca clavata TaxID=74557 RepID=A0A1W0A2V9_9STRA|nr:coatomer subunit zeta-1 [Thraustotheca clavata]